MPRPLVFRFTLSGPGCLAASEADLESPGFLTHPSVHLQACASKSPISARLDLDSGPELAPGDSPWSPRPTAGRDTQPSRTFVALNSGQSVGVPRETRDRRGT